MSSFALVTEGITDQVVIERIIYTIIEAETGDDPDINILQPLRDATDRARQDADSFGGWEAVLEYCCDNEKLTEALQFNDFLVIQLDTDCCEHKNFNVPLHKDGLELAPAQLIADVKTAISSRLSDEFKRNFLERIIFAIAVHSTECWLIPAYESSAQQKNKTKNCYHHLTRTLAKKDIRHEKTYEIYRKLSSCFAKEKNLTEHSNNNESLRIFIDTLRQLALNNP